MKRRGGAAVRSAYRHHLHRGAEFASLLEWNSPEPMLSSLPTGALERESLSETSIGGASIAGLEKAVQLLDTLGSSMSSLNAGSGFITGVVHRGNKIFVLAFEVANTIAKAATLWKSFSDESIRILKEDVLKSDGVRLLVSLDEKELLCIAAADKSYLLSLSTELLSKEHVIGRQLMDLCAASC